MKKLRVFTAVCMLAMSTCVWADDMAQASADIQSGQNVKFFKAVKDGDVATVKQMASENNSLINSTDKNGYTPLHNAAYYGQKDVANELLAQGANINATNAKHGTTPLHSAASKKCNGVVVKSLLDKGADQTKKDTYGKTALEYASQCHKKHKSHKNRNNN
jgi:ankyrin repeat protein